MTAEQAAWFCYVAAFLAITVGGWVAFWFTANYGATWPALGANLLRLVKREPLIPCPIRGRR